ncbi:MAG TPA: DUF6263 family protein [Edaphocola sp.]|nr:DUF6263 family protein [Edaphocola sp.]
MNRTKYVTCILLCALFSGMFYSCTSSKVQDEAISFGLNLPKGNSYLYTINSAQDVSAMGSTMHQQSTIEVNYESLGDSNRAPLIEATVRHIVLSVNSPAMKLSFDSRSGSTPNPSLPAVSEMLALANQTFKIQLDSNGRIRQVYPVRPASGNNRDTVLTQLLQQSLAFYPGHPVKIGDSWTSTVSMPVQEINAELKTTYTLTARHGDTAIIGALAELKSPKKTLVLNQTKMSIEMNGAQKGTLKVYIPEGRLLNATFSSKINGLMEANGQTLQSNTEGQSTISSEKMNK